MARIDPDRWPDRLAFERHARALRREEADRLWRTLAARLARWFGDPAARPRSPAAARRPARAH